MRLSFMGTPAFAVPSLRALCDAGHQIGLVVTQPDRPAGRRKRLTPPPVKLAAEQLRLPVLQPEKVREPSIVAALQQCGRPDRKPSWSSPMGSLERKPADEPGELEEVGAEA